MSCIELQMVTLDVDQIEPFAGNPRIVANPEYERIEDSIRCCGINQPLIVTRKDQDESYVLAAGGNTRLNILKKLSAETGDRRFREVQCVVQPHRTETEILLAHLRENNLRANLSFIEKALAVEQLKTHWAQEVQTQRDLSSTLTKAGFAISQSLLSQMSYAVTRLYPVLICTLKAGMGRPAVEAIRRLDVAASALWAAWRLDTGVSYDDTFGSLCQRHDSAFDIDDLQRDIEYEIAQATECSLEVANLALAEAMDRRVPPLPRQPDTETSSTRPTDAALIGACAGQQSDRQDQVRDDSESGREIRQVAAKPADRSRDITLRRMAFRLARRLADRYGLVDVLIPTEQEGIGFLLSNFPDSALVESLEIHERESVALMWWILATLCELTALPPTHIRQLLATDNALTRVLVNGDQTALRARVSADLSQLACRLWSQMNEQSWDDFVELLNIYRQLCCPEPPSALKAV